jgi:hypothetical protein
MGLEAIFLGIGAAASVAGAGISAYGQQQQGKTAMAMAQYNAHQQMMNAQMQLATVKAQAEMQKRVAEANFRLRQAEAQARFNNAQSIENTVHGLSRNAREQVRRKMLDFERLQGTQRAVIAKSGLVESTGTPLDILAETAATIQLEREDMLYQDELNRRTLFREAEMERFGGKMALAGATLDRSVALAQSRLTMATGQAQYQGARHEAEIIRLTGAAQQQSYQNAAMGTLFSGIASAAGGAYSAIK